MPIASLPFRGGPDGEGGEWSLLCDGTLRLLPSDEVREGVEALACSVDEAALKWGTSLVVVCAVLGAAFYTNRRKSAAWTAFSLSGGVGWLARSARRGAQRWGEAVFHPHSLDKATIAQQPDGSLLFAISVVHGAPPWELHLSPGDFDQAEADTFLAAVNEQRTKAKGK